MDASEITTETTVVRDPVCGMTVDPSAGKPQHEHAGHTYHFCSEGCRGKFDWRMATRVAELARAGRRPTCITGPVRCTAAEWHENQHGRWPVVAPALPGRFPGGVWRPAMKDRKGRERYEGHCTPVTYDPTPQQVAASRRDYLAWWAALHEVRQRLLAASVLRDHELNYDMPPTSPISEGQDR